MADQKNRGGQKQGNRVRRHSSLGFLSPVEYERAHNQTHR
jgi:transposase InsO family protein